MGVRSSKWEWEWKVEASGYHALPVAVAGMMRVRMGKADQSTGGGVEAI